eukprot:GEMP01028664.1.p1 GENE.GEMP01028664.1~~GEMP01028664.1.p1  ORF type:complete len:329 (+),score=77.97 GEMP01028664.1:116-1102(+)
MASDNVIVRIATAEDATNEGLKHSLLTLINESHRAMMADLVEDPARYRRLDMEDLTERLEGIVHYCMRRYLVLLFLEGEIAGCCSVTIGWNGDPEFGHFGLLTVGRKFQRRGFGTRLAAFAEDFCCRAGVVLMQCEELSCADKTVHPASKWLEDFYAQKLHFQVVEAYRVPKGDRQRGARIKHNCHFLVYHKLMRRPAIDDVHDSADDVSCDVRKDNEVVTCDADSARNSGDAASPDLKNDHHTMSADADSSDDVSREVKNYHNAQNLGADSSDNGRSRDVKNTKNTDIDVTTDNIGASAQTWKRTRSSRRTAGKVLSVDNDAKRNEM